jgi:hypothetical protein
LHHFIFTRTITPFDEKCWKQINVMSHAIDTDGFVNAMLATDQ